MFSTYRTIFQILSIIFSSIRELSFGQSACHKQTKVFVFENKSFVLCHEILDWYSYDMRRVLTPKAYFRRRAVLRRARTFSSTTAQLDVSNLFIGALGRAVPNAFERRAARLSTALTRCLK